MSAEADARGPVIFFDDECALCNNAVDFLLRHERAPTLRFAALRSAYARAALGEVAAGFSSLVLQERGDRFMRSDAVWRVARLLRAPWSTLAALRFVPRPLREAVYRAIAASRYRLFGRRAPRAPSPAHAARFLA